MRKNAGAGKTALAGAVSVAMALTLGVPTTALADNWGGGVADSSQRASETRSLETDVAGAIGGENATTAQAAEPAATADAPVAFATGVATTSDGAQHATLQAAIDAAAEGDTVTLQESVTENVTVREGVAVTIDLNGNTLSGGTGADHAGKAAICNNGTLTILDGVGGGVIKRDDTQQDDSSYYVIDNQGTLTIKSGTVQNNSGFAQASGSKAGSSLIRNGGVQAATLNIEGGTFQQDNFIAIKNDDYGVLNMTGGTVISAEESAVQNWAQATISGGIVNGLVWTSVWNPDLEASATVITGKAVVNGEIRSDKTTGYGDLSNVTPTTQITGGVLNVVSWGITEGTVVEVSGGTFSSSIPEAYLADGYKAEQNSDGKWVPVVENPVASVNGEECASFEAAIEAAQPGDTVTLLADAETQPVVIDEGIIIDLGGKTLSIVDEDAKQDDAGITFTNGASTIKNGSIVDTRQIARTFAVVIDGSDAALTMEDATLTVQVPTSGDGYGMRVLNGAELTLNDGAVVNSASVSGNTGYIYGITVYGSARGDVFDEETATKLTVNEGATIEAYAFAVSGNGGGDKDNTLITVNGGTLISEAGPAIYHPQYGKLVINGGTLAGCSGVEIRAGELEVNGGTIKGDTEKTFVYPKDQIGGGNSVDGGGIIVAQHSTKLPVKVTVNGGAIEANTAFIQHNVMENEQASIDKIEMSITGGEFVGALRSDNFKDVDGNGFVSGGSFSDRAVGDFLAHDAAVAVNDGETPFDVYPSEGEALANGGAHKVVDGQNNSWIFSDEDAANDFAETVTGGKVEVVTRSVTFDDGIDATKDAVVAVPNGDPVAAPADPERDGYTFAGWFSDEACTQAWDFESPVTSDMTLYAKWAKVGDEGGEGPIIPIEPGDEGDGQKDDAQKDEAEGGLAGTGDAAPLAAAGAAAAVAALVAGGAAVAARRRG